MIQIISLITIFLLIFSLGINPAKAICPINQPIAQTRTCLAPHPPLYVRDIPGGASFLTGLDVITFEIEFEYLGSCESGVANRPVFTLAMTDPASTEVIEIIRVEYEENVMSQMNWLSGRFTISQESDTMNSKSVIWTWVPDWPIGGLRRMSFSFDTVNQKITWANAYSQLSATGAINENSFSVPIANWKFDSTTEILWGTAVNPPWNREVKTKIQTPSLIIFADYVNTEKEVRRRQLGLSPTILGGYSLVEAIEGSLIPSEGSLGAGWLGQSGTKNTSKTWPKWTSEYGGIKFTSPDQFVSFPNIPLQTNLSMTVSLWIKLDPSFQQGFIFRYTDQTLSQNRIFLKVYSDGILRVSLGNINWEYSEVSGNSTIPLPVSQWTLVTLSVFHTKAVMGSFFLYYGTTLVGENHQMPSWNLVPAEFIRIGGPTGFIGQIGNVGIYQPGTNYLEASCDSPSSCPYLLGIGSLASCIVPVCDPKCDICDETGRCAICKDPYINYKYQCMESCGPPDNTFKIDGACYDCDESCATCSDSEACITCPEGYKLVGGSCEKEEQEEQEQVAKADEVIILKNLNKIASHFSNFAKLIFQGPSSISSEIVLDLFHNIKFYNISYPDQLQTVLYQWDPLTDPLFGFQQMPDSLVAKFPTEPLPPVFEKYDLPSSFLVNYWNCLILVTAIFITFLLSKLGFWIALKHPRKTVLLYWLKNTRIRFQNFLIAYAIGAFGEFLFCASIGYQTTNLEGLPGPYISFIICIICSILFIGLFLFNLSFLIRFQSLKKKIENKKSDEDILEKFKTKNEGFGVFFGDFNIGFWQQSYLPILMLRDLSFYSSLTLLSNYPLIQVTICLSWIIGMILYQIFQSPFDSKFETFQHFFYEINLLIVNFCLFKILSLNDSEKDTKDSYGQVLIITNIVFNFLVMIFLLISMALAIHDEIKNFKEAFKKTKVHPEPVLSPTERKLVVVDPTPESEPPTNYTDNPESPEKAENAETPKSPNPSPPDPLEKAPRIQIKKELDKKETFVFEVESPAARSSKVRNLKRPFKKSSS